MPPPVESLIQTSLSHYNALSTQQGVDALGILNSPTSAAVAAAAAKQQSNSSISSSSVNWQSYFNTKISKDKLTSKQKRNSCIAVMSEFSTSPISPLAPQSQQIVVSNATTTTTTSTNLRDSIGSFQSYVQSTSASSMLASATATITKDPNSSGSNKDSISGVRGKKNFKQIAQLSSIFTSASNQLKNIEQTRLMEKLNSFMKELPKLPDELNVKALDMSILEIEPDWCKYVGESFAQSLPVRLAKQQMAIWELLSTECSHIKTIKVIIDVFLCCLINLKCSEQTSELFKDIDTKKIFCNITDVFNCNLTFWTKYLHPIVLNSASSSNNSSSTSKNIIDPLLLVNAFADFKCLFAPYEEFILERNNSTDYFKQKLNENENFLKFINWAENHPLVGRLKIADFMMIPVQRLTKYQLLIENIYQHTDDESRREKIAQIKEIVNGLPNTINIKLNYIAQFNDISDSIERYEGISGPTDEVSELLNSFKSFDIKSPLPGCSSHTSIRELIFQGPLKLKEASKSACDVYCFLFTDMLLITQLKKASKKYRIIKPPVPTNRMLVKELTQTDKAFVVFSLNDYNVPDSVNMFISNFSRKWIEYLELSKKKYIMELEKSRTNEANSIILRSLKSYNFEAGNQQPVQPPQPHDDYYPEMENEPPLSPTTPVSTPLIPTSPLESPLNIEPPRRDSSSATLTSTTTSTPNTSNVGSPILENVITSSLEATTDPTSPPAVSQPAPRPYQKRMDRQRRNMTDPTQHHNGNPLPASVVNTANDAASIVKRNSLNDAANRRRGELEEENMKTANRGDSTSTILSTDSGVSCFDLESISIGVGAHRPVKGAVTTVQQSTIKLNVLSPSSSPSSSSSYSSSSPSTSPSNFVISSSSSSDKPTSSSSSSSEANCGYDMVRLAHQEENDDEDYYNDDDLIIDSSASIDPNRNGSTESSNNNNNESKTINNNAGTMNEDIYNNSNGVNNPASDLNRQLMFRKQNNIRVKQSNDQNLPKHLRNLKQQQQQQNTSTNSHQFDMNNNQTNEFYDYNGVTPTSNNTTNTNTNNNSSQRKPMIKIKSTTLKNESVRIQANEISNNSTPANFDNTVNSAHSNASNPDDDSHQRMMLVNLIHATMDATEV